MIDNIRFVLDFMVGLRKKTGEVGIAPHCYFPQFLDEEDPVDRSAGIQAGLDIMKICKRMYVVGQTLSEGMQVEIDAANKLGLEIVMVPDVEAFFAPKPAPEPVAPAKSQWPLLQKFSQVLRSFFVLS
jgi:hypothetical protein